MKISPLGATRSNRGPDKPRANNFTLNPAGTDSTALVGCGTTRGPFPAEVVAYGAGKSASVK